MIEPHQPAEDLRLKMFVRVLVSTVSDPIIEKLRNFGLSGASAALVRRDDEVAQHFYRFPLVIVEGLAFVRLVLSALRLGSYVHVIMRLPFDHAGHKRRSGPCPDNLK